MWPISSLRAYNEEKKLKEQNERAVVIKSALSSRLELKDLILQATDIFRSSDNPTEKLKGYTAYSIELTGEKSFIYNPKKATDFTEGSSGKTIRVRIQYAEPDTEEYRFMILFYLSYSGKEISVENPVHVSFPSESGKLKSIDGYLRDEHLELLAKIAKIAIDIKENKRYGTSF